MKVLVSIATVSLAMWSSALAQAPNRSRGQGYVFVAPGVGNLGPNRGNIHIGAGGEAFIYKGLGIGAELGPLGPWSTTGANGGWSDWVVGLGSANLSYHFLPSTTDRKFEPFVTAGYSLFFRAGLYQGYNVGSGVNVWLKKNAAMRFEVRNHRSWNLHTVSFRIGVTFR